MAQPEGDFLMPLANGAIAARLMADFAEQAAVVLERRGKGGFDLRTTAAEADEIVRDADFLDWTQPLSVAPAAAIWVGAPRETWMAAAEQAATPGEEAAREEWVRFVSQTLSAFAELLAGRLGIAIDAGSGSEAAADAGDVLYRIEIGLPTGPVSFFVGLPSALLQALADFTAQEKSEQKVSAASMDLLLDVELPLSVSFGRTFLPVRDILRLATGSVVELNRHVNDYVDVIVNNCVIARGEVVVIEGNYGIRVHEIVSRRERAMLQHMNRSAPLQTDLKASA